MEFAFSYFIHCYDSFMIHPVLLAVAREYFAYKKKCCSLFRSESMMLNPYSWQTNVGHITRTGSFPPVHINQHSRTLYDGHGIGSYLKRPLN